MAFHDSQLCMGCAWGARIWGHWWKVCFLVDVSTFLQNIGSVEFFICFHSHSQDFLNKRIANTVFVLSDSLWVTAEQISQVHGKILIAADRWWIVLCRDWGLAVAGQSAVQQHPSLWCNTHQQHVAGVCSSLLQRVSSHLRICSRMCPFCIKLCGFADLHHTPDSFPDKQFWKSQS